MIVFIFYKDEIVELIKGLKDWYAENVITGMLLFLFSSILSVLLFIPGSVAIVGGCYIYGTLYGKFLGYLICWGLCTASCAIGGQMAFYISRSFFYENLKP